MTGFGTFEPSAKLSPRDWSSTLWHAMGRQLGARGAIAAIRADCSSLENRLFCRLPRTRYLPERAHIGGRNDTGRGYALAFRVSKHVKPMDLKAVDLNLLKAFDALMTERAVTRAGQRIGLSQPAMSAALLRLRELFRDPLFIRTQTGMEPTLRTTQLALPVQDALRLIQEALKTTSSFDPTTTQRTFVIGMTDYAEIGNRATAFSAFAITPRFSSIHIRAMTKVEYIHALDEGAIDLFVGHADQLPPRFNSAQLPEDPIVLMARRKHEILKEGVTYDSLVKWPHVLVSPSGDAKKSSMNISHERTRSRSVSHLRLRPT